MSVGIDHDTASFAVRTIGRWWQKMGRPRYRRARSLLITADAGGRTGPGSGCGSGSCSSWPIARPDHHDQPLSPGDEQVEHDRASAVFRTSAATGGGSRVETAALAGERGAYRLTRPVEHLTIPATVQAILAVRVDRLAPEAKRLLQAAAVIG